ncbi:MAG TPA: c-type cytochrome [Blastocatellia bacterium]|nr:c-type cytochrome [Blastocatellia bacterium]HMX28635.1 c-type cytochrome [Blastocatellia bacterium]HMY73369.1 c-type cytochrome [Blastocatellia bacterium]HNG34168.1 c-type cytochrome [Blastocatellia bacterium]
MNSFSKTKMILVSSVLVAALPALSVGSSFATAPATMQNAAAIYTEKCAKCHGADGKGAEKFKKQGVKDFTDAKWQKANTDAKITADINNGKGDFMPAWKGKLKPAEVTALVKHIRSFGKK